MRRIRRIVLSPVLMVTATIVGLLVGWGIGATKESKTVTYGVPVVQVIEVPVFQLDRSGISEAIQGFRQRGDLDAIAEFYNGYVNDRELTYLILSAAQVYKVPENVLFALIRAESNYNKEAYNGYNTNGTNDRGLMQLNSKYFGGVDRMDPYTNLQHGCKHLRDRYEKYGTWDEAIMYYNGFSQKSVHHQARVLAYERSFDKSFMTEFWRQL